MGYIKFINVSKSYATGNTTNRILTNTSLSLKECSFSVIVGPSGTGKTTILNMLAGFDWPTKGELVVAGYNVNKPSPKRAVVFQSPTIFPWKNVFDNIICGLDHKKLSKRTRIKLGEKILDEVGLSEFKKHFPHEISGGMQQRVGIARAMIMMPDVLLMDEPFSALDQKTRDDMQDLIVDIWKNHKLTILFVTHALDEAIKISTNILIVKNGNIELLENILPHPRLCDMSNFMALKNEISSKIA